MNLVTVCIGLLAFVIGFFAVLGLIGAITNYLDWHGF